MATGKKRFFPLWRSMKLDRGAAIRRCDPSTIMQKPTIIARALLAFAACALSLQASAHEVWIEDTPEGQLFVRFAKYGDDFEKSPGALDALTLPFAWKGAAAASEKRGAVISSKESVRRSLSFYARWHNAGKAESQRLILYDIDCERLSLRGLWTS